MSKTFLRRSLAFLVVFVMVFVLIGCKKSTVASKPPVISGADDKTIEIGTAFDLKTGVTATDDVDGNITDKIVITGEVDTNKVGDYSLVYSVENSAKLKAVVTRKITVKPKEKTETGVLTWSGLEDQEVIQGDKVNLLSGLEVTDSIDGDISNQVFILNDVDHEDILKEFDWYNTYEEFSPHIAGNYIVYYGVTNSTGVTDYKYRNYQVRLQHNVPNGNFEIGAYGWRLDTPGGDAALDFVEQQAVINITNAGTEWWQIQFYSNVRLTVNETYKITVRAKSEQNHTIAFGFEDMNSGLRMLEGINVQQLSSEFTTYTSYYTADSQYNNIKAVLYLGHKHKNDVVSADLQHVVTIDEIYIEKVEKNTSIVFTGAEAITLNRGQFTLEDEVGKTKVDLPNLVKAKEGTADISSRIQVLGTISPDILNLTNFVVKYVVEFEDGSIAFINKNIQVALYRSQPYATINGSFDDGFMGWVVDVNQVVGKGKAKFTPQDDGTITIEIEQASTADWHIQLFQVGMRFEANRTYFVKVRAKANQESKARIETIKVSDNNTLLSTTVINLTTEWEEHVVEIKTTAAIANVRLNLQLGTTTAGSIVDVDYIEVERLPVHAVTWNYNFTGSHDPVVDSIDQGEKIVKPTDPVREGYTFLGWFDGDVEFDFENTVVEKAISLIAKWEEITLEDTTAPTLGITTLKIIDDEYVLTVKADDDVGLSHILIGNNVADFIETFRLNALPKPHVNAEELARLEGLGVTAKYDNRTWIITFGKDLVEKLGTPDDIEFYFEIHDLKENVFGSVEAAGEENTRTFSHITDIQIAELETVYEGSYHQLVVTTNPINAIDSRFEWVLEENDIIRINKDGLLFAIKAGTHTLKVQSIVRPTIFKEITVTVLEQPNKQVIYPTSDVTVRGGTHSDKTHNNPEDPVILVMTVDDPSYTRKGLFYFDYDGEALATNELYIERAVVRLYLESLGTRAVHKIKIYGANPFDEADATWNNIELLEVLGEFEFSKDVMNLEPAKRYIEIDVTHYLDHENSRIIFSLETTPSAVHTRDVLVHLYSKEAPMFWPTLLLDITDEEVVDHFTEVAITTPASTELELFETMQLEATITPPKSLYKDVSWSSSDPTIIGVDQNGLIQGINEGVAKIKVSSVHNPEIFDEIELTVQGLVDKEVYLPTNDSTIGGGSNADKTYNEPNQINKLEIVNQTNNTYKRKGLLYFVYDGAAISAAEKFVKEATLRIYIHSIGTRDVHSFNIYSVEAFDETTVTWNNAQVGTEILATFEFDRAEMAAKPDHERYIEIDVLSLLDRDNYTLCIAIEKAVGDGGSTAPHNVAFNSKEAPLYKPSLIVEIQDEPLPEHITEVNVQAPKTEISVFERMELTTTTGPENAINKELVWSSSDPLVLYVDQNGVVEGVNAGTATIRVASKVAPEVFDEIEITVTKEDRTYYYLPTNDSTIKGGTDADVVHNTPDFIKNLTIVKHTNDQYSRKSLLYFEYDGAAISAAGENVFKAVVRIYIKSLGAWGGHTINIYKAELFDENTITWNNAQVGNEVLATFNINKAEMEAKPAHERYVEIDVTKFIDRTTYTLGLALDKTPAYDTPVSNIKVDFHSKEAEFFWPRLILETTTEEVPDHFSEIELVAEKTDLFVFETTQLSTVITPLLSIHQDVVWSTSDSKVIYLTQDGLIQGLKAGTATVKVASAHDETIFDEVTITVSEKDHEHVYIATSDSTVKAGNGADVVHNTPEEVVKLMVMNMNDNNFTRQALLYFNYDGEALNTAGKNVFKAVIRLYPSVIGTNANHSFNLFRVEAFDEDTITWNTMNVGTEVIGKFSFNKAEMEAKPEHERYVEFDVTKLIDRTNFTLGIAIVKDPRVGGSTAPVQVGFHSKESPYFWPRLILETTTEPAPDHFEEVNITAPLKTELEPLELSQLEHVINPEKSLYKDVVWSSSNPNVIWVDQNGLVQAVTPGTATVKVSSLHDNTIFDEIVLIVKESENKVVTVATKDATVQGGSSADKVLDNDNSSTFYTMNVNDASYSRQALAQFTFDADALAASNKTVEKAVIRLYLDKVGTNANHNLNVYSVNDFDRSTVTWNNMGRGDLITTISFARTVINNTPEERYIEIDVTEYVNSGNSVINICLETTPKVGPTGQVQIAFPSINVNNYKPLLILDIAEEVVTP